MLSDAEREAALAEYNALRAEILQLVRSRDQFLVFDLVGFGAVFAWAVGTQSHDSTFFLIAPLIHYPLGLYWSYADGHISRIGGYIRDSLESRLGGMGWEQKMFGMRKETWSSFYVSELRTRIPGWVLRKRPSTQFAGLITFAGTTMISLLLWLLAADKRLGVIQLFLLLIDFGVFPYLLWIVRQLDRNSVAYLLSESEH